MEIAGPAFCICREEPLVNDCRWNPRLENVLALKDPKRWEDRSICANALNHRNPFLTAGMRLMLRTKRGIKYNSSRFHCPNRKPRFIHVICVLLRDSKLLKHLSVCVEPCCKHWFCRAVHAYSLDPSPDGDLQMGMPLYEPWYPVAT